MWKLTLHYGMSMVHKDEPMLVYNLPMDLYTKDNTKGGVCSLSLP
jgi:hypothetical protein